MVVNYCQVSNPDDKNCKDRSEVDTYIQNVTISTFFKNEFFNPTKYVSNQDLSQTIIFPLEQGLKKGESNGMNY